MSWPDAIAAFLTLAVARLPSPDPARVQGASVAAAALVVLLAATALATVKPRGMTRYGHRAASGGGRSRPG